MAADILVHRAMVHARAAADAAQHFLHLAAQDFAAAIVEQDDVKMFRAVSVGAALGAGQHRHIIGDGLPGGRAGQQAHQRGNVFQRGHDFFYAGNGDVHARQCCDQATIAFIGDNQHGAGFGHQKVAARDAHVGIEKNRSQYFARFAAQLGDIGFAWQLVFLGKQVGNLFLVFVHYRRDDMRGGFLCQLQDIFAQIGFHHLDAGPLQSIVQTAFFTDHGFGFGRRAHPMQRGNLGDDAVNVFTGFGPVYGGTACRGLLLEFQQPLLKIVQHAVAYGRSGGACFLQIGNFADDCRATFYKAGLQARQCRLQFGIRQFDGDLALEIECGVLHYFFCSSPASTSAMCNTRVVWSPLRRKRPSIFSKQPRSPPTIVSAWLAAICRHLLSAMRVDSSPYLTEKVPPKPQQVVDSTISLIFTAGIFASNARGCL